MSLIHRILLKKNNALPSKTESAYLLPKCVCLRNTFSKINREKSPKLNYSKMEVVRLSKRKPHEKKLFCQRENMEFYEEKRFEHLQKNL